MLVRNFLKAYLVCLVSLLSIYVVVDLFTNLEDFSEHHHGLLPILKHIASHYVYKIAKIFDLLAEAIVLMAAAFTVALIQRNNELVPLLSAGLSTQRVVRPILLTSVFLLGLSVANQELIIPRIATRLMNDRDDPNGQKDTVVQGAFEPNGIHLEGEIASRKEGMVVRKMFVVIPESLAGSLIALTAKEGWYIPPGVGPHHGGWLLTETTPAEIKEWSQPDILEPLDDGKYFLYTQDVDFDTVTRNRTWYTFASTGRLYLELGKPDSTRLAPMAVLFHMRLTRPVLGMLLVLSGLSVILRDQNRNVFLSAGMCLVQCAVFFAAQFVCKSLGDNEYLSPALAAWLPVFLFGPFGVALFDAVHT
jgi:lipopolysaccharide export system permease protein